MRTNMTRYSHSFTHYQQKFTWDCGLSCVLMLLDLEQRADVVARLKDICEEENFGRSTWTIDLCYLLKRFNKTFMYTTITLGVDPGYSAQGFYSHILDKDTSRVMSRFQQASEHGITVEERSCSLDEILEHLRHHGPCIVLTNANIYSFSELSSLPLCGGGDLAISCWARNCVKSYQGHYVLLVGFDMDRKVVIYRNPSHRDGESEMSFTCFEEARTSYGTDEDVIFVFMGTERNDHTEKDDSAT